MYQIMRGIEYLHGLNISHRGAWKSGYVYIHIPILTLTSTVDLKVNSMHMILISMAYMHKSTKPENILLYAPGPFPRIQIAGLKASILVPFHL